MGIGQRSIVALDGMTLDEALSLATRLSGHVYGFKVTDLVDGLSSPRAVIAQLYPYGRVFVDVKLHDIPQTVENRVKKLAHWGAHLISVHASGGPEMMRAAVKAYETYRHKDGLGILAVTVLTSLTEQRCEEIYGKGVYGTVRMFAEQAERAGAYGIVCSPRELLSLQESFPKLKRIVPGIRSRGVGKNDQARTDTPGNAFKNGAHYLVIGRQVVQAKDPVAAVETLGQEMATVT